MSSGLIGIPSRIIFLLCGLLSLLLSRIFLGLRGFDSTHARSWSAFSAGLVLIGGLVVLIALLPASWVEKVFRIEADRTSSIPTKTCVAFALADFCLVVGLAFSKPGGSPAPEAVFLVCPSCALTMGVDPSSVSVLLILAPLSAAVYGSLGAVLGYVAMIARERKSV